MLCFVGKDGIVLLPAHLGVAVVGEWSPHLQNQNGQNGQKDLIKKAHGPGHLTKILLEMLARKPKGKYNSPLAPIQSPVFYKLWRGCGCPPPLLLRCQKTREIIILDYLFWSYSSFCHGSGIEEF